MADHHGLYIQAASRIAGRVPVLKALPITRLLMAGEVLVLGKGHLDRLTPEERGRLTRLLAKARGRPRNLTTAEQTEFTELMAKLDPRLFLAESADKLSPVGVPGPLYNRIAGRRRAR